MNKWLITLLLAVGAVGVWGIARCQQNSRAPADTDRILVTVTLYPLYDLTRQIGGDRVQVAMLVPPGTEAHSFEPSPSDILALAEPRSQLLIYTGIYMEPWIGEVTATVHNDNLHLIDASEGIELIANPSPDPHIWLDFENTQKTAEIIAAALAEADPNQAEFFMQNAERYKSALGDLDERYRTGLANCATRSLVFAGHDAFTYLARRYQLNFQAAQGLTPEAEPTAADLTALIEQIKQNHLIYVFFEELESPGIAQTIAGETDAQLLQLNSAHTVAPEIFDAQVSFIDIMNGNLNNLRVGLDCQ